MHTHNKYCGVQYDLLPSMFYLTLNYLCLKINLMAWLIPEYLAVVTMTLINTGPTLDTNLFTALLTKKDS